MCLQRLNKAIAIKKLPRSERYFQKMKKRLVTFAPLSSTDATSTSHIYEATIENEITPSNTNKGHRTNSISVVSYYKYILRNITRVIYRNQNKRF